MARIAGTTLPKEKKVKIGLTYIFGIGHSLAQEILNKAKVDGEIRVKDLTEDQVNALRTVVDKEYQVEGELRREVLMNVKRLKEIGTYRGLRHLRNLPSRGQRTKTNNRTRRGNKRVTMGSGKKPTAQKT